MNRVPLEHLEGPFWKPVMGAWLGGGGINHGIFPVSYQVRLMCCAAWNIGLCINII